jgi:hypothetical protein
MRMVLVGSPCKARRRHLLSPSVTEHRHDNTVILKSVLVHVMSMGNFHSHANRIMTKLCYYFKHNVPYSSEKLHQISIYTQINLSEAKVK